MYTTLLIISAFEEIFGEVNNKGENASPLKLTSFVYKFICSASTQELGESIETSL